jgi:cyclohexyl-isocyanide hydratase
MKMAFILFDGMTSLDLIGFYDAVTRLRLFKTFDQVMWDFCGVHEEVVDDRGMTFRIRQVRPNLSEYDLVFVPGGFATRQLRHDADFIGWLQTAREAEYKVSVCTGALLLGAAGFLQGKRATTNASAYELLTPYCSEVVKARVVRDGRVFTGGGVSASIDLGLYVIEHLAGVDVAKEVQQKMDYPYYRPGQASNEYMSRN